MQIPKPRRDFLPERSGCAARPLDQTRAFHRSEWLPIPDLLTRVRSLSDHIWFSANSTDRLTTVGEQTGPITGNPPSISPEVSAALKNAAESESTGSHVPGKDAGSKVGTSEAGAGEKKVKSEKERTDAL